MDNPKTIKDVMQGIDSLTQGVEWSEDKKQSIVYFVCDGEKVMSNVLGHSDCAATSIAIAMATHEDFRDIVCCAYQAYIRYMANKLAPAIEPIAKAFDKAIKDMQSNQSNQYQEIPTCVFSEKFKPRQS